MGRLPPELLDLVVSSFPLVPAPSYLPRTSSMQGVAATIGNCGLVCRDWLPSSRRVLFRRIRITPLNSSQLVKLVEEPELATFLDFVREMEFVDTGSNMVLGDNWFPTVFPQVMGIVPSPSIFRCLRLRTFRFYSLVLRQIDQCPPLRDITTLRLFLDNGPRLTDLATTIAFFPALEALHLSLHNDWADRTIPDADCKLPPTFHSLSLEWKYMAPFVAWMRNSRPSISNLKISFDSTVYREKESQLPAAEFISSLQGVLTSLTLRFCDTMPTQQGVWDAFLKRNTNIRELFFRGSRAQAALLLQRLHKPAALMLRRMVMIFALEVERRALVDTNIDPDWCGLDALLAPLAIELLQMSFTPTQWHLQPDPHQSRYDVDRVQGEIPERLPRCFARGIITVVDFDESMWDED
ncbi:hypothetical protein DFH06DRAFT_1239430 [Mycena polygramma]|nr:hypothetical protein DFH06DRAFT_1239430 [Mycena polygramma]